MKKSSLVINFFKENEKKVIFSMLFILMLNFFSFGLYHLTKFETVDEHFWKYERVGKYWKGIGLGIKSGDWKKTYINDKPGVTVAMLSGVGLLFEPNPQLHRNRDPKITANESYTVYNQNETERINFLFRFPILLFSTLLLPIFYWLIRKITNKKIAVLTTIFISTSPILIGMSQIINPDALLWSFATLAIFSFLALLKENKKKFLFLTAVFSGLALLSKYTANILFIFYILAIFSNAYFDQKNIHSKLEFKEYFKKHLNNLVVIFFSAVLIYSIFLPAVFEKSKYLFRGTINSPVLEGIFRPLLIFLFVWVIDVYVLKGSMLYATISFFRKFQKIILISVLAIVGTFFLVILINPYLSTPIIPLDDVKEDSFVDKELVFPQLQDNGVISKNLAMFSIEMQPFVFSLSPVVVFLILFLLGLGIYKGNLMPYRFYVFTFLVFTMLYFGGNLLSGVLVNPRYGIMLYPLVYFLAAISLVNLVGINKKFGDYYLLSFIGVFLLCVISLWGIKPFYLNYESFLLPQKYILTDAWGYGEYEAAQYLNSLENSENIIVWSDRSALYQFINGKGIRDYKIDLEKTVPQYFVFSRRGSIRHKFEWLNSELAPKGNLAYYEDNSEDIVWELKIGNRDKNYVRVVRVDYK